MAKTTIGVDIGSTSIKAAEVQQKGDSIKILRVAEIPLARGVVTAGEVRDLDALADAVKQLWKEGKFSSKAANVSLGGPGLLVRQVDLPWETTDVFRESLPLRLANDLPVDPSEMTLDYHPLDEFTKGTVDMQRALIVGATNALSENTSDSLVAGGLRLNRADFSAFSLIRVAKLLAGDGTPVPAAPQPGEEWDAEVVIDVGNQTTTVALHYQGRPLFIRIVMAGAESLTRALSDNLQISLDEAEIVRRTIGISAVSAPIPGSEELAVELNDAQRNAAQYISNAMAGQLVQVVRESVEFFVSSSPNINGVSRILLSGGGALLPGYAERLSSELRAPASLLAPLHGFADGPAEKRKYLDPRMAIAVGAALEVK